MDRVSILFQKSLHGESVAVELNLHERRELNKTRDGTEIRLMCQYANTENKLY